MTTMHGDWQETTHRSGGDASRSAEALGILIAGALEVEMCGGSLVRHRLPKRFHGVHSRGAGTGVN
jgi:hypothetical protein